MKIKYIILNILCLAVSLSFFTSCVIYVYPPQPVPDTTPPSVAISSPKTTGSYGQYILVVGTASDSSGINKVYVTADGLSYTNEITGLDSAYWSTTLTLASPGTNTIRVWAADNKGNVSSPVSVIIISDFKIPSITIDNPSDGSYVCDNPLNIYGSASVSNDTILNIQLSTNGSPFFIVTNGTSKWTNSTPVNNGVNTVKAMAVTSGGRTNVTPLITFTYRQAVWNILVYMEADNNLEYFGLWNFNEMECVSALTNGQVNVLVLFNSAGNYTGWAGARLYQVKYDPTGMNDVIQSKRLSGTINGVTLTTTGVNQYLDMGNTNTLSDFVVWATNNYQAQYSFIILWDHGDGWGTGPPLLNTAAQSLFANFVSGQRSVQIISNNNSKIPPYKGACGLLNSEIRWALNGKGMTVIGFDACLMGMMEAVYEFKDLAQYMIASADEEPGYGWNYDDWLARFCASSLTPEALESNVIDSYHAYYISQAATTMAAYKLSAFDQLTNAFNTYVSNLSYDLWNPGHTNKSINHLSNIILLTEQYYFNSELNTDVWDLANHINVTGYDALKNAVNNFVYYEWHNPAGDIFSGDPNSHGLALYFSDASYNPPINPNYENNPGLFFTKTKWVDYLTNLYYFPPYQWISNRQIANDSIGSNGSLNYQFFVTNAGWVTINLKVPAGNNDDLYLYNYTNGSLGSLVTQSLNGVGINEKITYNIPSTGWYIIEVTNIVYSSSNTFTLSLSNTGGLPVAGIK